jgi:hypothetical protein
LGKWRRSSRFIITATDEENYAYPWWYDEGEIPDCEPCFEHYFFTRISQGYDDYSSYTYADTQTQIEWPYQEPLYDDQLTYTWFEWW